MTNIILSPSLLAADMGWLAQEMALAEESGITSLHIDVMDGNFVPNIAFGPDQVSMLRPLSKMLFDVHLMVVSPDRYIEPFAAAGADSLTFHAEACRHLHRTVQVVKGLGKKVGVALNPATPLAVLDYVYDALDLVLILTVDPGYAGQKYLDGMTAKIRELSAIKQAGRYEFAIQADGGINRSNIVKIITAGARNLVIGSAVFQKGKTRENIAGFHSLVGELQL